MNQRIDVVHVAELARIELSDQERVEFQEQLETIVNYVGKLDELDLAEVKPTTHVFDLTNCFREDVVSASLEREAVLCNAPARTESEFKLPKIVEDA